MDIKNPLTFKTPQAWRDWLLLNHAENTGVWLLISKKNSSKAGIKYQEALEEALCFGWIDGQMKSYNDESFILRFSPRKPKSVWSKANKEHAERLTKSGRMTDAGFAAIEEARENGMWEAAYTNLKKDEIPTDLNAALGKNDTARKNFYKFANSYRNMYIGWINSAKTDATRKKRIDTVIKQAALNKKLITD